MDIVSNNIDNFDFLTLLRDLFLNNYISEEVYKKSVFSLISLVRDNTNKEVSTIDVDKFNNLINSYVWVISYYLVEFSFIEKLDIVLNKSIKEIYYLALDKLESDYNKLKLYYNTVFKSNLVSVDNYFYNSTLIDGLKAFFSNYDMYRDPTNYVITCDYECFNYRPKSVGLMFISDYMKCVNFENIIVNKFDNMLVNDIVNGYDFVNIFEVVVNTSFLLSIINKDIYSLRINLDDISDLYNKRIDLSMEFSKYVKKLDLRIEERKFMDSRKTYFVSNFLYLYNKKLLSNIVTHDRVIQYKTSYSFMDKISTDNLSESEVLSLFKKLNVVELMVVRKYGSDYFVGLLNQYLYSLNKSVSDFIINNYIYVEVSYEE